MFNNTSMSSCATQPSRTLPRRITCPSRRTRSVASRSHSTVVSALQPCQAGDIHIRVQLLLVGPLEEPALPRHPVVPPEGEGIWGLVVQGRHHPLKKAIGVAVNSADFPVDAHKGSWFMITPEGQAHAILLKVADHVRQGAKHHKQWRLVLLSARVYIDVITKGSRRSGRPSMPGNSSCNTIGLARTA